jgi:cell division protein FtsN
MKSHHSTLQRQQGNTLTGIIIGLVIGLGIAVAVALLITKSSTPNKGGKSDKPDQPVTQLQDPNRPMYGKPDAVKEAAKEQAKDAAVAKPAEAAPAQAAVRPPEVKAETKPAQEKPAADKVSDKSEKAADAAADDKYIYFLQAGAFKEQADADSARAKLALIGFEARVTEKIQIPVRCIASVSVR